MVYVHVLAIDDNGNENPFANNLINFNLKGQGKIVGVDNGTLFQENAIKHKMMVHKKKIV
ncbi:hypothetical protein ONA22_02315 [Mycoplasmopsis cynos]|uniref:hypothetical protein n=1 Tax=Mycoplasmopsis cynos TaxID=171284 RepID=UPI0024CD827A|nr:hypothetical protein [Mycoplasmopsis cynos]WAM03839.1 hypothetical protein ONA22_02315 [Mycoplasmopsis cynos]